MFKVYVRTKWTLPEWRSALTRARLHPSAGHETRGTKIFFNVFSEPKGTKVYNIWSWNKPNVCGSEAKRLK